jgi:hypothetical protein
MPEMNTKLTRMIPAIVLLNLLAGIAAADEEKLVVAETTESRMPGKVLVETANSAAVKDAIEAVLFDNRMELEIRFNGLTSMTIVEGP